MESTRLSHFDTAWYHAERFLGIFFIFKYEQFLCCPVVGVPEVHMVLRRFASTCHFAASTHRLRHRRWQPFSYISVPRLGTGKVGESTPCSGIGAGSRSLVHSLLREL